MVPGSLKPTTLQRLHREGRKDVADVVRGRPSFMPQDVEINLMKLVLACDERGDISAGPLRVRHAVGVYIKDTIYEKEFKKNNLGLYNSETGVYVPSVKWYKSWLARMQKLPQYKDIVECDGRATDITKLKYYNTTNINKVVVCHIVSHNMHKLHNSLMHLFLLLIKTYNHHSALRRVNQAHVRRVENCQTRGEFYSGRT